MDVIEAIHSWRSIRSFRAEALARAEVENLLWHAVQVEYIKRLGEQAIDFARANRPTGETGWSWLDRPGFKVFWDAPIAVIISAEVGKPSAVFDCHRAGQNLALAAHACGLGSCWLGAPLPWLQSAGTAVSLGVKSGFEPAVVIALGHPVELPEPKSRPRPEISWHSGFET